MAGILAVLAPPDTFARSAYRPGQLPGQRLDPRRAHLRADRRPAAPPPAARRDHQYLAPMNGEELTMRPESRQQHRSRFEHPDSTIRTAAIPRAAGLSHGSAAPGWPTTMIEATANELARWVELWSCPRAAEWVQTEREQAVAQLVRLEQRCARGRTSRVSTAREN
jgi:hypothetical protein